MTIVDDFVRFRRICPFYQELEKWFLRMPDSGSRGAIWTQKSLPNEEKG